MSVTDGLDEPIDDTRELIYKLKSFSLGPHGCVFFSDKILKIIHLCKVEHSAQIMKIS